MAISASVVLEIRQGGSDTNGGGFHTGATGTDWSQQNTPQYSVTDGVTAGTTTITSATANFGTDVVGNLVYVQGGTGAVAANWYEITALNSATSITVDRLTGLTAGTGVTLHIGGALATPGVLTSVAGGIGGQLVSGQKAWVKYSATPTACSTATAGPAGPCSLPALAFVVEGYDVTRGDRTGNQPIYQWTVAPGALTYAYLAPGTGRQILANLCVDGNSQVNAGGFSVTALRTSAIACTAKNCNQSGAIGFLFASGHVASCIASACTTGFSGGIAWACTATGGTTGFAALGAATKCLAYSVPTGFVSSGANAAVIQCTADTCSTAGYSFGTQGALIDCLASNCTGTGFVLGSNLMAVHNCASYNNVTIASGTPLLNEGPFASGNTLTSLGANPYVSQATADFRPNANNPGGAQLRAAGIGVFGQTDSADIGAVQHSDPTASGFTGYPMIILNRTWHY